MEKRVYQAIASRIDAWKRCQETNNIEWEERHRAEIERLITEHLPHGSGFDNGVRLDYERSNGEKLVFITAFHHMNDAGYYDGWTDHCVTAKPSFIFNFTLSITGINKWDIKDYIAECFETGLNEVIQE